MSITDNARVAAMSESEIADYWERLDAYRLERGADARPSLADLGL